MGLESTPTDGREVSTGAGDGGRWEATRIALGTMYLLGALAHVALGLREPGVYARFADQALVAVYTDLWQAVVVPNLSLLQPLVVAFEFGLAVALLGRGRAVLVGHALGAVFQAGLVLSGPWGPVNAALAVVHLAALRRSYPVAVPTQVRRRVARGED